MRDMPTDALLVKLHVFQPGLDPSERRIHILEREKQGMFAAFMKSERWCGSISAVDFRTSETLAQVVAVSCV